MLKKDRMMAFSGSNNVTGDDDGDVGDSMFYTGILTSVGADLPGAWDCVSAEGRAYRHVSYFEVDEEDTFSRDQLLGLLHWCISYRTGSLLSNFLAHYRKTGDMCEGTSTDGRGKIRPSTWLKVGAACRHLKIPTPWMYFLLYLFMGILLTIEALTTPLGYQQHLVSQSIWLYKRTHQDGPFVRLAARILAWRTPGNLWFRALYQHMTDDKAGLAETDFDVNQLARKLAVSDDTTGLYWLWGSKMESKHLKSPCGWDFWFLRRFIQKALE